MNRKAWKKYKTWKSILKEAPDHDLAKKLKAVNNDIFKLLLKYEDKADAD